MIELTRKGELLSQDRFRGRDIAVPVAIRLQFLVCACHGHAEVLDFQRRSVAERR
jgi:hypothetical protein